jgi:epoxyqueuosine reductase
VLLRNVAVALGNTGSPDAIPALVALLADRSPLVRAHAVWALRRLGADSVLAGHTDDDPIVRDELRA